MPGQGRLAYIAGHRTTFLAPVPHIERLKKGDSIRLDMRYATFVYRLSGHRIVRADDLSVLRSPRHELPRLATRASSPAIATSPMPSGSSHASRWAGPCGRGRGAELHSVRRMTDDADLQTRLDEANEPVQDQGRFSFAQVELKWLPVGESAFLLWVLAALFGVWLLVGYLLGLI